ncbi:penicillin-binding protein 2 [Bacteroidia bacterium]|nr:penicillin-binding protein 2 [Bacteroidia bacterium]
MDMSSRDFDIKYNKILLFVIVVLSIFALRLFYLQVWKGNAYRDLAEQNALREITVYPARGYILDRNGEILVQNEAFYDLMVIPKHMSKFDTAELSSLLGISKADIEKRLAKAEKYARRLPSLFEKQINKETFALLQGKLYKYPGFYAQTRTLRQYPKPIAAHVLGYIGEVNDKIIKDNPYYKQGDYIGLNGLEKFYEDELRGKKGKSYVTVDVHNIEHSIYSKGKFDTAAEAGFPLHSTLDIKLQELAEELMKGKRGSIVAIEPETGEILAFVSAPCYNPNLLVGRERGKNYGKLYADSINRPLFDRALMAQYPPGSIFKLPQALIALQHGVITTHFSARCYGKNPPKGIPGCHNHPNCQNVRDGVKQSCNPYFQQVFKKMIEQDIHKSRFLDARVGLAMWDEDISSFGFGQRLGIDLPNCKSGFIPDTSFYDRWYGINHWAYSNFYSVSIGQGEVLLVPIQMANLAAIMANRGYYITPHLCRKIGDSIPDADYTTKHYTSVEKKYFDEVILGMYDVVHAAGGTGHNAAVSGIDVCGKTGTAENYKKGIKQADHAVFIGFAPMNNPKIAISVFVENSGFGGTWAAPIASLLIEQYINGKIKRADLLNKMKK